MNQLKLKQEVSYIAGISEGTDKRAFSLPTLSEILNDSKP
uniref:Uncharacterized protein n=1 Tax=Rhizophora mucronata TaxID=61149 RepID=A0A2P2Q3E3_RHIMU